MLRLRVVAAHEAEQAVGVVAERVVPVAGGAEGGVEAFVEAHEDAVGLDGKGGIDAAGDEVAVVAMGGVVMVGLASQKT